MSKAALAWLIGVALSCGTVSNAASEETPKISIAFVGDILLDDTPGKVIKQGRDPLAPFASLLNTATCALLKHTTAALVNAATSAVSNAAI